MDALIDALDATLPGPMRWAGAVARRIVCWARPGQRLARGERFGMIKLGSRTELVLPADPELEICVRVGDAVRAGSTVVARSCASSRMTEQE